MEKAAKKDDVPDIPGNPGVSRGFRKDNDRQRRLRDLDVESRRDKKDSCSGCEVKVRPIHVSFCDGKLEHNFESLKKGKFEDRRLYGFIERAVKDLKKDSTCGTKLPSRLWPKIYIKKYLITNLWKYDLPNGWRLVYTIQIDKVMILNVILEWFNHKQYERRFGY